MALLEVLELTKIYSRHSHHRNPKSDLRRVVDRVSFTIERGETLGLVGESGSGKSTIARMVLGLIPPSSGKVSFDGQQLTGASGQVLRQMRRRIQPVFQDPFAALNPRMRVAAILEEPFKIHRRHFHGANGANGSNGSALADEVRALLRAVGLDESALPRFPHEFSGGQRQRINIARALALRPELVVLDEPVSALDVSVGAQIVNLLRQLQREFQLTYLFISHSMPLVRYLSTNIAVLHAGKLVEMGECEAVCRAPREAYTKGLLDATLSLPSR